MQRLFVGGQFFMIFEGLFAYVRTFIWELIFFIIFYQYHVSLTKIIFVGILKYNKLCMCNVVPTTT